MIKRYVDELNELKAKMEKAEEFAKRVPLFEEIILDKKYTGEEKSLNFGETYKDLRLNWGIIRNHYVSDTDVTISNYSEEKYDKYLFSIYINSISLFGEYEDYGLEEVAEKCNVFFYDSINSTFYAEDSEIEKLLEGLNDWYLGVKRKLENIQLDNKIKELEEELSFLKAKKAGNKDEEDNISK